MVRTTLWYVFCLITGTRRTVGQAREFCNTEDEVCYFNTVVCMHGSLAGKTTHGKISPLQKSTKSESLTNFSVLPSPTLPTSELSKVRVINVQRLSDRYCVRNFLCPICTATRPRSVMGATPRRDASGAVTPRLQATSHYKMR